MSEDQLEQETLAWLADVGYKSVYGPEIAVDGEAPERSNYAQVVLVERLCGAINRLNPLIPLVAREDALQQVLNLDTPVLLSANRLFHRLLINSVPVEYQRDGETRGVPAKIVQLANSQRQRTPLGERARQGAGSRFEQIGCHLRHL